MLQNEADSLRRVLGGAITSAGSQTDHTFNLNPAYQVQRSGAQQSQANGICIGASLWTSAAKFRACKNYITKRNAAIPDN